MNLTPTLVNLGNLLLYRYSFSVHYVASQRYYSKKTICTGDNCNGVLEAAQLIAKTRTVWGFCSGGYPDRPWCIRPRCWTSDTPGAWMSDRCERFFESSQETDVMNIVWELKFITLLKNTIFCQLCPPNSLSLVRGFTCCWCSNSTPNVGISQLIHLIRW